MSETTDSPSNLLSAAGIQDLLHKYAIVIIVIEVVALAGVVAYGQGRILIALFGLVILGTQWLVMRQAQQTQALLETRVYERTAALTAVNMRLERGMSERESAEKRLTVVLNTVAEGILTTDTNGRIVMANREAGIMWGFDPSEMAGQPFQNIVKGKLQPIHHMNLQRMAGNSASQVLGQRFEMTGVRKNRSHFPVEMSFTKTEIDDQLLFTVAATDITERKRMETELNNERAMLTRSVETRTAELQQANEELARASKMKDEFLASMSHELRTPLNAILGLSEALVHDTYGMLNDAQRKPLHLIEASGKHLLDLINDILDVSKIEAGNMELVTDRVDVSATCESSLQFVRVAAQKKSIMLRREYDPQVGIIQADNRRLKQILVNLLSNAVKFTPENGEVKLSVEADLVNKIAYFSVTDTGIGISDSDLDQLFKPFVQIDNSLSRSYTGSGLGLTLVERLTEMHGGTVKVNSILGKGTTFTVALPWEAEDQFAQTDTVDHFPHVDGFLTDSVEESGYQPHVLLTEDNEINIATLYDFLEFKGFQITVAHDGIEALEAVEEVVPDLILMDIQMPRMDGLEAMRHLRTNPATVETPIIALTGLAMTGDRERCLAAGADDYLSKPFHLDELVSMMECLIATKTEMVMA
ncbi:MAG: ATP-binding protein [Candidatus Promineifilaceae bacterium]